MYGLRRILRNRPNAVSEIIGSRYYPQISGRVMFYQTEKGVLVCTSLSGLPVNEAICQNHIFAIHIHEGEKCSGTKDDPFADAKTHYKPYDCPHPYHSGDMPPLFGNDGEAFSVFLTNRFTIEDIIDKTVVVHSGYDDFTSQPAGNSGEKIGCGVIKKL